MNHSTLRSADRGNVCSRANSSRGRAGLRHGVALASLAGLTLGICSWSKPAAAESTLGVDLAYNDSRDEPGTNGAGIDVYFGPRMNLALLVLTTELSLGYHDFGGDIEPAAYRAMAGGRLGIGAVIRPSVFAHLGVGHVRFDVPYGDGRDGRTNFAGDLGAALDFTVLPAVDLGIQVSYNAIAGNGDDPAFDWLQAGAHVVFVFGS